MLDQTPEEEPNKSCYFNAPFVLICSQIDSKTEAVSSSHIRLPPMQDACQIGSAYQVLNVDGKVRIIQSCEHSL